MEQAINRCFSQHRINKTARIAIPERYAAGQSAQLQKAEPF